MIKFELCKFYYELQRDSPSNLMLTLSAKFERLVDYDERRAVCRGRGAGRGARRRGGRVGKGARRRGGLSHIGAARESGISPLLCRAGKYSMPLGGQV